MSIGNIAYGASMGHVWDTFYRRNPSKFVDIENESSVQPLKNGAPGRSSSIFKNVASRAQRDRVNITKQRHFTNCVKRHRLTLAREVPV